MIDENSLCDIRSFIHHFGCCVRISNLDDMIVEHKTPPRRVKTVYLGGELYLSIKRHRNLDPQPLLSSLLPLLLIHQMSRRLVQSLS